jgi:GT2 family glycosyltransferase
MTQPPVAIIIVNYNGAGFLGDLAASLREVTYTNYELWLIDNASPDGSGALLQSLFPDAEVILNQRNLGFAAACNQALARCFEDGTTEYALLLNPDTTHSPDFLDRLVESADQRTIVSPEVINPMTQQLATHAGRVNLLIGRMVETDDSESRRPSSAPRQVEFLSFACALLPREVFRAVGPLDERFGMYYEDTDYSLTAHKAGFWLIIQPASRIYHSEGLSSGGSRPAFQTYYAGRNRVLFMRKHAGPLRFLVFSAYYVTTTLAALAWKGEWYLLSVRLRAIIDAYRGRYGMSYSPADFRPWTPRDREAPSAD